MSEVKRYVVGGTQATPPGFHEYVMAADYEAALRAGDALAHSLIHREHSAVLDAWWKLRGHNKCTVCNPDRDSGGQS